ncbi:hypothetical protein LJC68_09100 [Bacteroidales bacterium OttesenSCG-928-B11]|nr:hypothetical protein [Bacteroidales bacterium OttesenSCG-928-E04]MDL2313017.1 hypothetical protein [Bacteroidales bacterium OttesenSCG-928-B11]MDL2326650.1 hypothetical protein [Bacteroidales bacterium OttesenSCG-928-A14]
MEKEEYFVLDDKHEKYPPYSSQCWFCKHFGNFECPAFPDGIPDKYLSGKRIHDEIDENQVGYTVFTELT